jgi:cell division protein ZapD
MAGNDGQILYEYPFSERVRTFLRLEDLFEKLTYFCAQEHYLCHHTALITLFEILEVTSRADLKSDLLQDLERHRQTLAALRTNPQVSEQALDKVLSEIDRAQQTLNLTPGKAGQHLRENEWLMSIRSRAIIPGGTCEFDLPSYHAWLQRTAASRSQNLRAWIQPLAQFEHALAIVLRLLRESGNRSPQLASAGSYQQMLQGKSHAMLQVRVVGELNAIPEISANKYMLWVRFMTPDGDLKPRSIERDVAFELALCAF